MPENEITQPDDDFFDEAVEGQKERMNPDEPNLQTPTELAGGGETDGSDAND